MAELLPVLLTDDDDDDLVVRLVWDSEEEEEMRKGRGCMLHYQSTPLRLLTSFTAQTDTQTLDGDTSSTSFLGPDWQVTGWFSPAGGTS